MPGGDCAGDVCLGKRAQLPALLARKGVLLFAAGSWFPASAVGISLNLWSAGDAGRIHLRFERLDLQAEQLRSEKRYWHCLTISNALVN